jgi:hypothetical protein
MNPNEAPIDVLHKSRLFSVILVMGFVIFLWLATQVTEGLRLMVALGAGGYLVYFLFFEIQKIEIFRNYLSIKYRCRKVRVERADIDNVSIGRTNQTSVSTVTGRYIILRLKSGRKIRLGNLRESADVVYEKLQAGNLRDANAGSNGLKDA